MLKLGWEYGQARIVGRQTHEGMYRKGLNLQAPEGLYHHVYDYVADVEPESGAPTFRAAFTELFSEDEDHVRRPGVGDQTRVKFHPKSEKVEFDRSVLRADAKASKDARGQQFDAIANAAPGSAAGPSEDPELEELGHLMAPESSDRRASSGGPSDSLERLEKLADLHQRGVLNDAEFAAEKAKILNES